MIERAPGNLIEQREKERPKEVVRMFLFQSRTPNMLPAESTVAQHWTREQELVQSIDFTDMVLLRKNTEAVNSGQLMPIGGAMEQGETPEAAIEREINEEAHLRTTHRSTMKLRSQQEYSFEHQKKGTVKNHSQFFVGRLLPGDTPFALDNNEDKIAGFERISVSNYKKLFGPEGTMTQRGETWSLLDSLQADPNKRTAEADQKEIEAIHTELHAHFQLIEADKKMDVLKHFLHMRLNQAIEFDVDRVDPYVGMLEGLLDILSQTHERFDQLQTGVRNGSLDLTNPEAIASVNKQYQGLVEQWKTIISQLKISLGDVKIALDLSNTEASIAYVTNEELNLETGVGVPTITLFFPILLSEQADDPRLKHQYEKILNNNPATKKLVALVEALDSGIADKKNTAALLKKLKKKNLLSLQHGKHLQKQEGRTNESYVRRYSRVLDNYFDQLFDEAHVDRSMPIHQLDEVRTENLTKGDELIDLVSMAVGSHDVFTTPPARFAEKPEEYEQYKRQLKWEANRKILLMTLLDPTVGIQYDVEQKGIAPIQEIEEKAIQNLGYTPVKHERSKTLLSLFRKMIVRDELSPDVARDHFAETLLFDKPTEDVPGWDRSTKNPAPEGLKITDKKGKVLEQIDAPPALVAYLTRLRDAHEEKNDGSILRITEYLSPAKGGHASTGPGGGGKIHFWKFYIQHVDAMGVERNKEVQAFFSQTVDQEDESHLKTAQEFFDEKKADDKRYMVRRLFSTKGLRSFMELLFPAKIYGDASRSMYKNVISDKNYERSLSN